MRHLGFVEAHELRWIVTGRGKALRGQQFVILSLSCSDEGCYSASIGLNLWQLLFLQLCLSVIQVDESIQENMSLKMCFWPNSLNVGWLTILLLQKNRFWGNMFKQVLKHDKKKMPAMIKNLSQAFLRVQPWNVAVSLAWKYWFCLRKKTQ